ncbi:MAG: hypothetical protein WB772_21060 [Xanthobacteraceae bacterium]
MIFKTVFDAADQGYIVTAGWFPAFGLIFVCLGALMIFAPGIMDRILPSGPQGKARRIFSWCLLIFAVLWTVINFAATYREYRTAVTALRGGEYAIVEGPVTDFVPMPYAGHSMESFVVGGHRFSYSDYGVTSGFHNTASHGGPIHDGLHVRISYVGNLILRLEVAQ